MVQLERRPIFSIHHSESGFDVFMRVVALGKSFPTHGHMRQSDNRGSGKVRFTNRAGSWRIYSMSRKVVDIEEKANSAWVPEVEKERQDNSRRRNFSTSRKVVDVKESCREAASESEIEEKSEHREALQAKIRPTLSRSIKDQEDIHTLDVILVYLVSLIYVLSFIYH